MRNDQGSLISAAPVRALAVSALIASFGCTAARGVGQVAGSTVAAAGNVAGTAVGTAGNVAGTAVGAAGNVAGTAVGTAGSVAGSAVGAAGNVAGAAVGAPAAAAGAAAGTVDAGATAASAPRAIVRSVDLSTLPHFKSPEAAARALVKAASVQGDDRLLSLLGPDSASLIHSGDPVEDAEARRDFTTRARVHREVERVNDDTAILHVGRDGWPLPIPIVRNGDGWVFDAAAGREEMLNRRIGENEIEVIQALDGYVEAQREYARLDPMGVGFDNYAARVVSTEGKHDGLYWPQVPGQPRSPIGPLFAEAASDGYDLGAQGAAQPFHGYFFRTLTAQGPNAPGGARNYVTRSRLLTGGFAMIAWPAEYGVSGVMTFLVNQRGIVYQKDLGPGTQATASAIRAFDPDRSWTPTPAR